MTEPSTTTPKPRAAINRKLGYLALAGIGVIGVFALLTVHSNDPRKAAQEKAEQAKRDRIAAMQAGSEEAGAREVDAVQAELDRKAAAANRESELAAAGRPTPAPSSATPATGGYPALDADMLHQLDEAQREAGASPSLGRTARNTATGNGGSGTAGDGAGGNGTGGVIYDNYQRPNPQTLADAEHDDLFGADDPNYRRTTPDGGGSSGGARDGGVYEAITAQRPPAGGIVNQGASIQAVLMTRIDTRVPGPITAMVSRTVYDSRSQRTPLIPQGSRLIGSYDASVNAGMDRIPVTFTRLILPDGRAVNLPQFQASGGDGTMGVGGRYHSNILRAIGPSFLVAVLGQAADRQINQEIPSGDASGVTPGVGGTYQSPTVMQQVMPQINNVIMQRQAGAKPYFTIQPGATLRVVVTADMSLPAPGSRQ